MTQSKTDVLSYSDSINTAQTSLYPSMFLKVPHFGRLTSRSRGDNVI
jgi:hypothetical protein